MPTFTGAGARWHMRTPLTDTRSKRRAKARAGADYSGAVSGALSGYLPTAADGCCDAWAGHTGPRTRDEHYNLACSLSASRDWNDMVEAILEDGRERRRLHRRQSDAR